MDFKFNRIFEQESTQEELFDNVAKPVVLKSLLLITFIIILHYVAVLKVITEQSLLMVRLEVVKHIQ